MRQYLYRTLALALLLLAAGNTAHAVAVLTVNGNPAYCDTARCMLLASVPEQWFGTSMTATVDNTNGFTVQSIDGLPLGDDRAYTFENIAGGRSWTVTCIGPNGESKDYNLQFTWFPIVAMEGDFGYDYTQGTMVLAEPGQGASEVMNARVKWRGYTTNSPDKHKRNYSIKFVNANGEKQSRKLLGMRRDNHWILDAGQADMARVRNRIATELWLDMARPPHYIDQAPDALTGVRGKVVEMFLCNEYRGIYCLTEAMDRKQLQLVKHDTINNVFHGGLWKTNVFNSQSGFRWAEEFNDSLPEYCGFETKYPELDEVFPTSYQVLYNAINAIGSCASIQAFNYIVDYYFDMPPIIDYTIFYLTLNANDNSARNIYWLCHDRAVNQRLSIAVWDLDATVGQTWSPVDWRPPLTAYNFFKYPYNWLFKMMFHNKCKYRQQFLDRYDELRATWLSEESLLNRYGSAIDRLIDCGAAAREEQRWNGDSDLFGHPLDFAAEKEYITEWFSKRLPLLDVWMHHHICDVDGDGAVTSHDITTMYSILLHGVQVDYGEHLDPNFDGDITAADVTCIYDVILGQ